MLLYAAAFARERHTQHTLNTRGGSRTHLTCAITRLHLQDLDAHQGVQQPLRPVHTGVQLPGYLLGAQGLLGLQQEVKHSQLTGGKDHL